MTERKKDTQPVIAVMQQMMTKAPESAVTKVLRQYEVKATKAKDLGDIPALNEAIMELHAELAHILADPDEYLIMNQGPHEAEPYELVRWWRPNSAGYTTNFDLAGRYTLTEATKAAKNRPKEDFVVPVKVAASWIRRVVSGEKAYGFREGSAKLTKKSVTKP